MFSDIWDKMKSVGSTVAAPLTNAYNNAMAPGDDLLADLADAEEGGAVAAQEAGSPDQAAALKAIADDDARKRQMMAQAGSMMAAAGNGGSAQKMSSGGGGSRGGGTNIQTEDQYAMAMKALTEKYGQFMFNKNF